VFFVQTGLLRRKKTTEFLGSRPLFFGLLSTKTKPRNMTVSAKNEVHVMGNGWFNRQADAKAPFGGSASIFHGTWRGARSYPPKSVTRRQHEPGIINHPSRVPGTYRVRDDPQQSRRIRKKQFLSQSVPPNAVQVDSDDEKEKRSMIVPA
jgi:hypothetical protein